MLNHADFASDMDTRCLALGLQFLSLCGMFVSVCFTAIYAFNKSRCMNYGFVGFIGV